MVRRIEFNFFIALYHSSYIIIYRLIAADRPYWWNSSCEEPLCSDKILRIITCETTPGLPSAKIALLFAIIYLFATGQINRHSIRSKTTSIYWSQLKFGGISLIAFSIVSISQIYLAVNFLHQCYSGVVFGIASAHLLIQNNLVRRILGSSRPIAMCVFFIVVITSLAFYVVSYIIVGDPRWSIHKVNAWKHQTLFTYKIFFCNKIRHLIIAWILTR